MIITVYATYGAGCNSQAFVKTALQEGLSLFTKDGEGNFVKLVSLQGIEYDTPVFLDVSDFLDIYILAHHFDILIRDFGPHGVCIALDSKGGCFKQR